ncbi:hypothetical protein JOF42_000762 [Microbacterium phyllosphaerae]|uniref:Uncharacterized protein n=1 Tax=Microbacterium phyllosphaerae TaxID=124798 RepID=A0ABS4WM42_9MICO|nr:hypothetical protein [Microbacterium phyllosphaerae]MBP2377267.1 hypothetical protein [Microbacterium phyllosphaerae]
MLTCLAVIALALGAGLLFGARIEPPFRWAGNVGALMITGCVIVAGIHLGDAAEWLGPLFSTIAVVTAVLVEAESRRREPRFVGESYWQRVLLVISRRSGRIDASDE